MDISDPTTMKWLPLKDFKNALDQMALTQPYQSYLLNVSGVTYNVGPLFFEALKSSMAQTWMSDPLPKSDPLSSGLYILKDELDALARRITALN